MISQSLSYGVANWGVVCGPVLLLWTFIRGELEMTMNFPHLYSPGFLQSFIEELETIAILAFEDVGNWLSGEILDTSQHLKIVQSAIKGCKEREESMTVKSYRGGCGFSPS
ncbi:uncharacterized protein [Euphorbia lathyris]|uniref:uncharacterized protein n=1 Tax=Euphorbia lathyris TaxID=212925 RepID=UPI0033130D93